jgi:hypothetical protein
VRRLPEQGVNNWRRPCEFKTDPVLHPVCAANRCRRATRCSGGPNAPISRGRGADRVTNDQENQMRGRRRAADWRGTCPGLALRRFATPPTRNSLHIRDGAQLNSKLSKFERFHRSMASEWAFARRHRSETARRSALPAWLPTYKHHRQHSATGKIPPNTR